MNLVQFLDEEGARRVAVPDQNGSVLRLIRGVERVYDLVLEAARQGVRIEALVNERLTSVTVDYDAVVSEKRLLPPVDHPDPAHCIVTGTGLTHLGSAQSRDAMHVTLEAEAERLSDSMKMFKLGLEGGKPPSGEVGVQPEWFYKGDGHCIVPPEQPLTQPPFAEDGGEEAELVGLYVIADNGDVLRIGFAMGNEFADHVLEKRNYLYLAHSKLRVCSFGPEVRLGELPEYTSGTVRIVREGNVVWSAEMLSGEGNMSHSLANLEHHHFKYEMFRRPGDVHIHFFGASILSFTDGFKARDGDVFEIAAPGFGRPLRNPLKVSLDEEIPVRVRAL